MAALRIVIALDDASAMRICRELAEYRELSVVECVFDEPHLLAALRWELDQYPQASPRPLAVLTSCFDYNDPRPMCLRLVEEFPGLVVYMFRGERVTRYRSVIEAIELPHERLVDDLHGVLAFAEQMDSSS
jgi:hypothetical protein